LLVTLIRMAPPTVVQGRKAEIRYR
jgi:hypothetical protein